MKKEKLFIRHHLSPGDVLVMSAAIRDLCLAHGDRYEVNVETSAGEVFENNPHLNKKITEKTADRVIQAEYPLIHQSNQCQYHFIHGFRIFFEEELGIKIPATEFKGDVHLSKDEQSWMSQIEEMDIKDDYWMVCAGGKYDYTAKWWNPDFYQEVISHFGGKITFVQVGAKDHFHPKIKGAINLIGKTDMRQLIRLVHHSVGILCPVTFSMHLSAAVPVRDGKPKNRACVVIAGGREPSQWEQYPHHKFLHHNGALMCCDDGGCWKSRCTEVKDGDDKNKDLCVDRVKTKVKSKVPSRKINLKEFYVPKCLDMIKARHVIEAIESYYDGGALKYGSCLPLSVPEKARSFYEDGLPIMVRKALARDREKVPSILPDKDKPEKVKKHKEELAPTK